MPLEKPSAMKESVSAIVVNSRVRLPKFQTIPEFDCLSSHHICLSVRQSVGLSVCLSARSPVCLSGCESVHIHLPDTKLEINPGTKSILPCRNTLQNRLERFLIQVPGPYLAG